MTLTLNYLIFIPDVLVLICQVGQFVHFAIFYLLACIYMNSVNIVDLSQLASQKPADLDLLFSNQDTSGFSIEEVKNQLPF